MTKGRKGILLLTLVGLFVLAFAASALADNHMPGMSAANTATGGGLEAAAIGTMGDTTVTPPLKSVLDLPALDVDEDANGRIIMDLPGLKLVGKPSGGRPDKLPVTGVNVGDMLALGMAALSGGGILVRRLRLSLGA